MLKLQKKKLKLFFVSLNLKNVWSGKSLSESSEYRLFTKHFITYFWQLRRQFMQLRCRNKPTKLILTQKKLKCRDLKSWLIQWIENSSQVSWLCETLCLNNTSSHFNKHFKASPPPVSSRSLASDPESVKTLFISYLQSNNIITFLLCIDAHYRDSITWPKVRPTLDICMQLEC